MVANIWRAASAIERRSSRALFFSMDGYIVAVLSLLIAGAVLHSDLQFLQRNAVFPSAQPLFPPLYVAITLISIYLALQVSLSISRERDQGTLEVLFYGPVTATAFLLGKFIAGMKVYAVMALLLFVWIILLVWILNFAFSLALVGLLLTSLLSVAAMVAFGLLVATLGGRTRNAIILFVLVVGLLLALQAAVIVTNLIPTPETATQNDPLLVLRTVLNTVTEFLSWVSPYAQLQRSLAALVDGVIGQYLFHVGILVVQTTVMLGGSMVLLNWRGTRG